MKTYSEISQPFKIHLLPIEKGIFIAVPYLFSIRTSGGSSAAVVLFLMLQYFILLPISIIIDTLLISIKLVITGWFENYELSNKSGFYKGKKYKKSLLIWILWALLYKIIYEVFIVKIFGAAAKWAAIIFILIFSVLFIYFLINSGSWQVFYEMLEKLFQN